MNLAHLKIGSTITTLILLCALSPSARAQNGVSSWTRQQSGTMAWLHGVFFLDRERGWVVGSRGVHLTTVDGGESWQLRRFSTRDTLRDIFFIDDRHGWIVCERNIYELRTNDELRGYLLKTEDGGTTWSPVGATAGDTNTRLLRVVFADLETGWTMGEAGALFATRNGGATWRRQRTPASQLLLGGAFLDRSQGWIVGAGGSLIRTTDGGETWRTDMGGIPTGVRLNAVSFIDARRGWAVGAGGRILTTTNGGATWREQNANTTSDLLDVKFLNAAHGWAVGADGGILVTRDGGTTWREERTGTLHQLERVFIIDEAHAWAVGFGGTILRRTPNLQPTSPTLQGAPARP